MIDFVVIARRWFSAYEGNTYHRVSLLNPATGVCGTSQITYGYGEQYRKTAYELAKERGYRGDYLDFSRNPAIAFFVSDVARKRDL